MTKDGIELRVSWRSECGTRPIQQDSIGWSDVTRYPERGFLAVLSDGMGGMKNGEVYSDIAVKQMVDHFKQEGAGDDIIQTLLAGYAVARREALTKCPNPQEPEGGATVVAVCIKDRECAFLSVGDSRLYLWRGGALIQLNREQTLGVLLDENAAMGYIPKEYAQSGLRDTIENNLCEPSFKRCDIPSKPFELAAGDVLLLMSDGISHTLTDKEIAGAIKGGGECAAEALKAAVIQKNNPKQDNYTIVEIAVLAKKEKGETEDGK